MTGGPLSILGQNSIHLGRIGLGYTKLSLGVKPAEKDLKTATYESDDNGTNLTYTPRDSSAVWKIQMHPKNGLYTIVSSESDLELYASDGRQYKNTFLIPGYNGTTRVFYHPKDEPSTYYLASSSGKEFSISYGTKLEQKILVTQKSNDDDSSSILGNSDNVDFNGIPSNDSTKTLSFTIYNPYPYTLNFTEELSNSESESVPPNSKDKFRTKDFPTSLPPGGRKEFYIIFDPKESGSFFADFTIQAEGLGNFVLELSGSGSGSGI